MYIDADKSVAYNLDISYGREQIQRMMSMNAKKLDRLLERFVEEGVPGCALAVSYRGETVYTGYSGMARLEDGKQFDENTIFQIYSNTKNITATAVMKLYEEGLLLLNDPVEKYLPFFQDVKVRVADGANETYVFTAVKPLRIKELLTMTAGIPYGGFGTMAMRDLETVRDCFGKSTMELAKEIAKVPLDFEPGTHFHYGLCFEVLAAVIEAVSGKKFSEYLKETIFEPLEMNHTTFTLTKEMEKNLATVYEFDGNGGRVTSREAVVLKREGNGFAGELGGQGALSTIGDMTNFATMLAMGGKYKGNRILSRNTIDLMRMNHLQGTALKDMQTITRRSWPWYEGYGWGLGCRTLLSKQQAGSNGSVGEFGWCGAAGTYLMADPEKQLGIAYAHQMWPCSNNRQEYCHPRVRNVVYGMLDDLEEEVGDPAEMK